MAPALLSVEGSALEHEFGAPPIPFALWPSLPRNTKLGYFIDVGQGFPPAASSYKLSQRNQTAATSTNTSFLEVASTLPQNAFKIRGSASFLIELPRSKLRPSRYTSFTGECRRLGADNECCSCCEKSNNLGGADRSTCKQQCMELHPEKLSCEQRDARVRAGTPNSDSDFKACTNQINPRTKEGAIACCECCNSSDMIDECQGRCNAHANISCPQAAYQQYNDAIQLAETGDGTACCKRCAERYQNPAAGTDCFSACSNYANVDCIAQTGS